MNQNLFLAINGWAGQHSWLDRLMIFSAEYLWILMALGVLALLAVNYRRWRDLVLVSLGSAVIARAIVAEIFKLLYTSPRPYAVLAQTHLLLAKETDNSFPSGHTIFVFALAAGVYMYHKKLGAWLYALAALVAFARIFTGVHWPYDIFAGVILGILTTWICDKIYRKFFQKIINQNTSL